MEWELLEVMNILFSTLSGLDYIGKRKQTGIFVKEEQSHRYSDEQKPRSENEQTTRTSFLADD